MKNLFNYLSLALLCLTSTLAFSQTTYIGPANGNWGEVSHWDNGLPGPGNDAIVLNGSSVVIDATTAGGLGSQKVNWGTIKCYEVGISNLVNHGSLQCDYYTGDPIINSQGINNITNHGSIAWYSWGTMGNTTNYGTIFISGAISAEVNIVGEFHNFNSLSMSNSSRIDVLGSFTNYPGATIDAPGTVACALNVDINNFGQFDIAGDFFSNATVTNHGVLNISWILFNYGSGEIENYGDINVLGANGSIENFGNIYNCFGTYTGALPLFNPLEETTCPAAELCDGSDNNMDGDVDEFCGCTDSSADNYNGFAVWDDGSCLFNGGCMDASACNYDSSALYDDGSCESSQYYIPNTLNAGPMVLSCTQPADYFLADQTCAQTLVTEDPFCLNTDWDALCQSRYNCCIGVAPGCFDNTACNFDVLFEVCTDNSTCTYPGCTDSQACNFDPNAGCDDGSCTYPGCNISAACNYDSAAGCDDGSCTFPGCNISSACNYDSTAGCDDGSCNYPGCNNISACNYDLTAACDDGSCEYMTCRGCTGQMACNYDSTASIDDGTCEYASCAGCKEMIACNYDAFATIDDGSCEYNSCAGCKAQNACNYDSSATIDDNSCDYTSCAGCTYPGAPEYDSTATIDDGSCTFEIGSPCPGDFNDDGQINANDLLTFLGVFGDNCD